ncbi:2818_t:CDS:2 [Cetraspora pellucida]|uniref:2818_t:CDS:1 n=1 Tax=Cetraspora pellucida TaxID=1433469 RepID=A0A9N9AUC7_9GLOM|nr:2818_t:CDS:2 [Cetraspora pellucida]
MFYIQMLSSCWYCTNETDAEEPFISDFRAENLTTLEQKIIYRNIHNAYKRALYKTLQNKTKLYNLIELLKKFAEDDEQFKSDDMQDNDMNNKENSNLMI